MVGAAGRTRTPIPPASAATTLALLGAGAATPGLVLPAAALTIAGRAARDLVRYWLAVDRIGRAAVEHDIYDPRIHREGTVRQQQQQPGWVRPDWRLWQIQDALPVRLQVQAKVGVGDDNLAAFLRTVTRVTAAEWSLEEVPRSRRYLLNQAPPLPEPGERDWPDWLDPRLEPWRFPLAQGRLTVAVWDVLEAAHLLIGAGSGWGKSRLVDRIIYWAIRAGALPSGARRWTIYGIDPDAEMGAWDGAPGVARIAVAPADWLEVLKEVEAWLDAQTALYEERHERGQRPDEVWGELIAERGRVLVVIDELAAVVREHGKDALLRLANLAQRLRKRGGHIVAGTQQPNARTLPTEVRDQFDLAVAGRLGQTGWEMTLGDKPPGWRKRELRRGRGFWRDHDGDIHACQAFPPLTADQLQEAAA